MELKGRNVINESIGDRLKELDFNNKDTLYLHIAHIQKKDSDVGIFACAFYTNLEGSNNKSLVGQSILQKTVSNIDSKHMAMESYELALKLVYSLQNVLYLSGVQTIHIVTDNSYLYKTVQGSRVDTTGRLAKIENKYLNIYGTNYISLNVSLDVLVTKSKARKYCNDKYVNLSDLKFNNLNDKLKTSTSRDILDGVTVEDVLKSLDNLDINDILS